MSEKIQKVLAHAGLASRRTIEQWITAGRVTIDGKLAKLGDRIDLSAHVKVDDQLIALQANTDVEVLMYHKPCGEICTRQDPEDRPTIFEHLPELSQGRWIAVGRLDVNTAGLLLLTNQGELANRLMHPRHQVEREYWVRVLGQATTAQQTALLKGVMVDGEIMRFNDLSEEGGRGTNHWYRVVLSSGRYHEVRRLWEAVGLQVNRLIRVRYGSVILPKSLGKGEYQRLNRAEVKALMESVNL